MCYNSFSGGVGTIGIQSALQNIPAAEVFRSHRPRSHRQDLAELAGKREDFPCLFVQRATGDGKNHRRQDFCKSPQLCRSGNKRALRRMPFLPGNCRGQQPGCCGN